MDISIGDGVSPRTMGKHVNKMRRGKHVYKSFHYIQKELLLQTCLYTFCLEVVNTAYA